MQRLHVQLLLALQLDKSHRRPRRRLSDRLCIPIVVFLGLDVGPHIFRRHQPNLVALRLEKTAKMMGAAAGLHCDDARRQAFSEPNDTRWPHAPPFDDLALTIQPHEAAAVLAKINSENCNLHLISPALRIASNNNVAGRRGGPSHKLRRAGARRNPTGACRPAGRNLVSDAMKADSLHYEAVRIGSNGAPRMQKPSTIDIDPVIYLAIELSASTWLVVSKIPTSEKTGLHRMEAGDSQALLALIADLRKKVAAKLGVEAAGMAL